MTGLELIWVSVIGAAIGTGARYLVPRRGTHGLLLVPAVGFVATTVLWVALVWLGWTSTEPWIWLVSFAGAVVASALTALFIGRHRVAADDERLHALSGGRA